LTPLRAYELFKKISDEDAILLWTGPKFSRPETLITWSLAVPPVPIRPSVPMDIGGGSNEDDLTVKLQEIIDVNNALRLALKNGATIKMVIEDWEFLQIQVAQFVNGEVPGIPRLLAGPKPIRGLCQRLKGKQGRFRGNLSGKRVDFSGRTVISPDPNLRVEQIGVPVLVAKILTFPERVNRYNLEKLQKCVINGPEIHPGANMIRQSNGFVKSLAFGDRQRVASSLKIGDIVERHMEDDDIVLFNRQPSLHKMSIMCHKVKVFPWRTFRFNECACTPYNADFDGDEMNLHLPQTEEARAEAGNLMLIQNNLITPRNGEPLVAATQDFLTGSYLLTRKDTFLTRDQISQFIAYFSDAAEHIDLPPPTILKPRVMWTGKQVISVLVKPNKLSTIRVNVDSKEKFYTSGDHMCAMDGYCCFYRGELISGQLGKKTLGGDSKTGLFYVLIRDYGPIEATRCMSRIAKFCARYLGCRGFSIGINDVTPSPEMEEVKFKILAEGKQQSAEQINLYNNNRIQLKPGCDSLQSLESELNGILGKVREKCGKEAMSVLRYTNAPLIMAQCGSKGSQLNISQMIACLGQQSVGGSRIQNGFVKRTLPHFPVGALSPEAKGFVGNSFFSGLTATEFFFHTMGGREGLVDTAVKTAETGYMARRLMKALEDLSMQYDSTVRNSEQTVVQFSYGDDGLNPQVMEGGDRPVDYRRLFVNVQTELQYLEATKRADNSSRGNSSRGSNSKGSGSGKREEERSLLSYELLELIQSKLKSPEFQCLLPQGGLFLKETFQFFEKLSLELKKFEDMMLPPMPASGSSSSRLKKEEKQEQEKEEEQEDKEELSSFMSSSSATGAARATAEALEFLSEEEWSSSAIRRRLREMSSEELIQWKAMAALPLKQQQGASGEASGGGSLTREQLEVICLMKDNALRVTKSQVDRMIDLALTKYSRSMIEPGEAVGAVGAQSISEPGTQMTLKTFHFAGVASMNVTLGVPRLKEIINASKVISTPIITANLVQSNSKTSARIVKAQIEKTTLGQVASCIEEVHTPEMSFISIQLDMNAIQNLHLIVNAHSVRESILKGPYGTQMAALRAIKEKHILIMTDAHTGMASELRILPPEGKETMKGISSSQKIYFILQSLKTCLPHVIVQGISTVARAVINEEYHAGGAGASGEKGGGKRYYLLVEGYGLSSVMGTPGVDGYDTKSNHIIEVQHVLGIEAARTMISSEIGYIMSAYGITVDRRHLLLLSDVMTFKGEVLGITRFGVAKMRESVLMLASFEKTTDHLFDAAVHSRQDSIVGVSECIIMGVPIPLGTGLFKLVHRPSAEANGKDNGGTGPAYAMMPKRTPLLDHFFKS
jgi:DNA-directed RNA polymerase III subunit RPC1